ncbi:MAG: Crp/Fnr family transcriptional regulator [Candidatus Sericytochromatia bacterium]
MNLKEIFKSTPLFSELIEEDFDKLEKHSIIVEFEQDEFLFCCRDDADHFYFILEGQITLQMFSQQKGAIALEEIEARHILGWSWMFAPFKWRFDAFASKKSKLVVFNAKKFREEMEKDYAFGYRMQRIFMKIMLDRMLITRQRLLQECGDNIYLPD